VGTLADGRDGRGRPDRGGHGYQRGPAAESARRRAMAP
jgi:hypothetical protein